MKLFSGPSLAQYALKRADASAPEETATVVTAPLSRKTPAPALAPVTTGVRIMPVAKLAQGGRWRVEAMRSLSEPLLLWFTRGQGRITVGGVTRGYGVHNAIFIPAGMMHGFELGPQAHGTAIFFGRGTDLLLPTDPKHLRIREPGPQNELSGIIENVQRELDSDKPGQERAAGHHLGLMSVWLERQIAVAAVDETRPDAARRLVARYTDIMERDYATGRTVADYASELDVTPTHLTRVCNQTCGRSASTLLHDRVLFEARRMLTDTDLPVNKISMTLGFTSAAYFTRAFQNKTGKTPTAFRKAR